MEEREETHPVEEFLRKVAHEFNFNISHLSYEEKREKLAKVILEKALSEEEKKLIERVVQNSKKDLRKEMKVAMVWNTY